MISTASEVLPALSRNVILFSGVTRSSHSRPHGGITFLAAQDFRGKNLQAPPYPSPCCFSHSIPLHLIKRTYRLGLSSMSQLSYSPRKVLPSCRKVSPSPVPCVATKEAPCTGPCCTPSILHHLQTISGKRFLEALPHSEDFHLFTSYKPPFPLWDTRGLSASPRSKTF